MLDRTPVIRSLYKSIKQIFETVFSQDAHGSQGEELGGFPIKGSVINSFITSEPRRRGKQTNTGLEMTWVFLPSTPNRRPDFCFVPTKDISNCH